MKILSLVIVCALLVLGLADKADKSLRGGDSVVKEKRGKRAPTSPRKQDKDRVQKGGQQGMKSMKGMIDAAGAVVAGGAVKSKREDKKQKSKKDPVTVDSVTEMQDGRSAGMGTYRERFNRARTRMSNADRFDRSRPRMTRYYPMYRYGGYRRGGQGGYRRGGPVSWCFDYCMGFERPGLVQWGARNCDCDSDPVDPPADDEDEGDEDEDDEDEDEDEDDEDDEDEYDEDEDDEDEDDEDEDEVEQEGLIFNFSD